MNAIAQSPNVILRSVFGFEGFRPGQEAVIQRLLEGHSALAIFPTGGGKSLCYQIPALLLDGLTLVISPLIALMKDQIDTLRVRGVAAARLDSSQDAATTQQVYADLEAGRLKLLYIAPERLANERFLERLGRLSIALLAVDEAHCISEWGHNFRPEYLKIASLARQLGITRVLGLTATATPQVAAEIVRAFSMGDDGVVHTGFYRANLTLLTSPTRPAERDSTLLRKILSRPTGASIVYVTQQRTADVLADYLTRHGRPARAYHAGLESDVRTAVQEWFMQSANALVVATIAFGMGIDKADIRYVYHYNLPKSLENYAQEIGRAGRDGAPAVCELMACEDDVTVLENFIHGDTPDGAAVQSVVSHVLGLGSNFDVSTYELGAFFDMRPVVVQTLLTYLELDGVLACGSPFYSEYKLQFTRPLPGILQRFDAARRTFLTRLLGHARQGRTWLTLDVTQAASAMGEPRQRVVTALAYLEEHGWLTLQVAGVRQGYHLKQAPADPTALAETLTRRFLQRENADLGRLRTVLSFAGTASCITRALWAYFGEALERDCGHCGWCQGERPVSLPPRRVADWSVPTLPHSPALMTPRQKARFLCGLGSPMTSRVRLTRHPLFGCLGDVPFQRVLAALEGQPPRA